MMDKYTSLNKNKYIDFWNFITCWGFKLVELAKSGSDVHYKITYTFKTLGSVRFIYFLILYNIF